MLVPALRKHLSVEVISQRPTANGQPPGNDERIYQLGNNPHHAWIYEEAMRTPGVVVLHDVILHHLIVEMTLARGDVEGYVDALRDNHGEVGAAWARGRAAGLHSEMGNFLMPASTVVANRSRAVIVHNRWAADRLSSLGVTVPIHVVPHPYEPQPDARSRRDEIRARHGFDSDHRVIGFFGFLTSAKRAEIVLEAFARAQARDPRLRLLIVGEAAPNIDLPTTGYVDEADFGAYFAAVDRLVNLRYPSAGETSGTLV
jgi:glycosyltransferase involved in cell wall biosynthesis